MADISKPIYGDIWANSGEKLSPSNTKIASGWVQEMMTYQFENFLQNRTDTAISYLLQKGIAEWSADQEYVANKSVVTYAGQLYMATSTVTNVLPTVAASWKKMTVYFDSNGTIPIAFGGTGAVTAANARTNLGIGTIALQAADAVSISGGAINSTPIGATTPSTGKFTNIGATGTLTASSIIGPVTGNSSSATKLATPRTVSISGAVTGTPTNFDGSANIEIPITTLDVGAATVGVLAVNRGGTGVTTSTGTGANVQAVSPALTGTPTAPTAADGTSTTQLATTAFVQGAVGGFLSKTTTGGTTTLTTAEASNPIIKVSGALTSNAILEIPVAAKRNYSIENATTGAFTLTVKHVGLTPSVLVAQGKRNIVMTNGVGAYGAINDFESIVLTGTPTAPTAGSTTNNTQVATTAFVRRESASPTVAPTYSFAGFGVESVMSKFGWTTGGEWAWVLDANGSLGWHAYNKGVWLSKPFTFEKNGNINIIGSLQTSGTTPSLTHSGAIGSSFGDWTGGAIPVIRIDAADRGSAYMLWRVTRPNARHVAAMHVHETTGNDSSIMTSLSMAGGTNQHIWYGSGMYGCKGNVSAAGVVLTSDERLKDIKYHVVGALEKVRLMDKVYYTMKGSTEVKLGYTASSVKKGLPEAVSQRDAREEEKLYTGDKVNVVDYNAVSVLHGAAIDELHVLVKALREELAELKRGK